jgi:hypothetical protein
MQLAVFLGRPPESTQALTDPLRLRTEDGSLENVDPTSSCEQGSCDCSVQKASNALNDSRPVKFHFQRIYTDRRKKLD